MADDKLRGKQMLFCLEYLKDMNATRAYLACYDNVKKRSTAQKAASRLLQQEHVRKFIDAELDKMASAKIADVREVMQYLTSVMRGEICEERAMVVSCGDYQTEIEKVKIEVAPKDRNKAAELLGRRYSMFTDNLKITETPVINDDI